MGVAHQIEAYLEALAWVEPILARRIAVRALLARDSASRWWEVAS